ncbi:TPA: SEL1-like repeat protein [Proteus mirabilis]|nr:SEL1-like repeat protein [Proteus mirabilis]
MPFSVEHDLNDFFNSFYHDISKIQPEYKPFLRHHVCGDLFAKHMGFASFKSMLTEELIPIDVEGLVSFLSELESRGFVANRTPIQLIWPKKIKFTSSERKALWLDQLRRKKSVVQFTDVLGLVEPIILPDGKGKWDIDPKNKFDRQWFVAVLGEDFVSKSKGRNEGFQHIKQKALEGDVEAAHPYALYLLDKKEYGEAFKVLHAAALKGNADCHAELGMLYVEGIGVERNLTLGKKHYEAAAAANHNQALHALATLYSFLNLFDTDIALSFDYHLRAARAGNHMSMGCVAKQYLHGFGVEKNIEKALYYATWGAECLDGCSLQVLGEYHAFEKGDWTKAFGYFKASAMLGFEEGSHYTGWCLLTGTGTDIDIELSCQYLEQAADKGRVDSMWILGAYYCEQTTNRNYPLSFHWLRKAAEHDHAAAINSLGVLHLDINAKMVDYEKANYYFKRACDLHLHQAFCNLSESYRLGRGVNIDYEVAFKLMQRGAELGSKRAMKEVSQYHFKGFGTEIDYHQSDLWLQKYQNCEDDKPYHYVDQVYANAPGYVVKTDEVK